MLMLRLFALSLLSASLAAAAQSTPSQFSRFPGDSRQRIPSVPAPARIPPRAFTTPSLMPGRPASAADSYSMISNSILIVPRRQVTIADLLPPPRCYTLRTYGFTPNDLRQTTPTPSTYLFCTPRSAFRTLPATTKPAD